MHQQDIIASNSTWFYSPTNDNEIKRAAAHIECPTPESNGVFLYKRRSIFSN
jgi:hypothetical protein